MDFNLNFHPLDNLIKDKTSFWLEALVPFVDYKYKKYLILYIKYKEITAIMSALDDIAYVESQGFNCKARSIDDVINGLAGFMPRDFSENIKQMKNMIDMMNLMNTMDSGGYNLDGLNSMFSTNNPTSSNNNNLNDFNSSMEDHSFTHHKSKDDNLLDSILNILDHEQ